MAISGYGQNFGESNIVYSYYGSNWHEVPGVERIEDHHHIGTKEHTEFDFPDNKNDMKCLYKGKGIVYMTESNFTKEFINITSTAFVATHRMWHHTNAGMDYPKDLFVTYNLEWTTINKTSTWNNAVSYGCTSKPDDAHIVKNNDHYGYNYPIPETFFSLNTNKLWKEIEQKADNLDYYNKYGYIDIFLRNVYYCKWYYTDKKGWKHEEKTFLGYAHTSGDNVLQIRIFKCGVGNLTVNSECNPQLETNLYAIYENQKKGTLELSSTVDKVSPSYGNVECTIKDYVSITNPTGSGGEAFTSQPSDVTFSNDIYVDNISTGTFKKCNNGREFKSGQKFEVYRSTKYNSDYFIDPKECESNRIEFLVLPSPTLDGIYEEPNIVECPTNGQLQVGVDADFYENEYKIYPGNKCDFGAYSKYDSVYGVKYRWVYSTDKTPEKFLEVKGKKDKIKRANELFTYNPDNTPDLKIPLSSLEEGVTYKFRQCVILETFENAEIYAPDDVYYTIKISKKVKEDDLTVEVSQPEVCMGDNLEDVQFTAKYKEGEAPSDYNLEKFSFNCKIINGDDVKEFTSDNEVNTTRNFSNIQNDVHFVVSMQDGCGSEPIVKEAVVHANPLPTFTVDNIKTTSSHVSLKVSGEDDESYLIATVIRGRECKLQISDSEKSLHDYYYSLNEDGSEPVKLRNLEYKDNIKENKILYFFKKNINGTICQSKPVKVQFVTLNEVTGNRFSVSTIYLCPGSTVPALNQNNIITDPDMGSTQNFKCKWQYSSDALSWAPMKNVGANGEESYFEEKNYDGNWQRKINEGEKIYLRRIVTAVLEDGTELGTDESDVLTVTTYSKPNPNMVIDGTIALDKKCYGDTITLSMSLNNSQLLEQQEFMISKFGVGRCLKNYGYYHFDGEKHNVLKTFKEKATDWKMPATQNYMIQSAVEFCGDTIFSSQSIEVETYEKIDVTPTVSSCKVVGNEITVKAAKDGHLCEIRRGSEVFAGVEGVSTAKIKLTEKKEYKYDIEVQNVETKCKTTLHKSIKESEIEDRKTSVEIGPNGISSQTKVCAGVQIPLSSTVNDEYYKSYSWSVNGDIKTGETGNTLNFTFPEAGKSYKVKRTCYRYEGTELCYTVTDSTTIETVGALEVPTIALSEDSVCNGEGVEVTVTAKGGGSGTVYDLVLMPGNLSQDKSVSKDGSLVFNVNNLTVDSTFYAIVTDNTCTNKNIYKAESQKAKVTVEKSLSMEIKPANNVITPEDFKGGKTTVSVVMENVSSGDVITYSLTNGVTTTTPTTITYNGSAFSLSIDSTLFDTDQKTVDLKVQRKGAKVGKCECSATYPFRLNEGFLGTPIIISNDKTDMIEVCAGQEVELSVDNANEITFGERSILEMADAQWKWFYGNSPMATGNTYKFTVDAGRTYSYTVVFSGKDEGGRTRRISSTPFIVKGGAGMKVGGISFEGHEQNYIEFCKGSKSEVAMSCGLDPDKVAMKWEYSHTAAADDWTAVPAAWNGNKTTVAKSISVAVNNLGNKKTYFRVVATDDCGTSSQSDNYLSVSFKTDVENPRVSLASSSLYSSDQPLPDSIVFNRYYYHDDPYLFLGRGEVENLEGKKQKVFFGDNLHFGKNSVSVVRSEKAKISEEVCMSDTIDYAFNIFKKLVEPILTKGPLDSFFCPNDGQSKYLHLDKIAGGDSATYKTIWQYKLESNDNWFTVNSGNNLDLFNATFEEISRNAIGEYWQTIYIDNLMQTVTFRAIVSCGGGYPGGYTISNEIPMNVYAPLKDNDIDYGTKTICFNSAIDTIKGYTAVGGSGKYTYTWEWSTDTVFTTIVKGEDNDPYFAPTNEGGKYNLKTTTYFRRKVSDDVCKTSFYSNVKKVVVRDSFNILPENVKYDRVVSNGSRAEMAGITDFSQSGTGDIQYIWWKTVDIEHAKSAVGEKVYTESLLVPDDGDSYIETYYVQSVKGGCTSANKMPIDIYVYNQTGGHIYVEGHDPEKGDYWTCSGMKDIQIASDDYAPNASFSWFYLINSETQNRPIKGYADGRTTVNVTSPEVRLDTTNMILDPFPLKNTLGERKTIRIFRLTRVQAGGETNNLYSDTITIKIVPTLESVSNALFATSRGLAGDISVKDNKKNYCLGETPNMILGYLEPTLAGYWDMYKEYFGPWLYDDNYPDGFKTYYEYQKDNGEWTKDTEYDYSQNQYAGSAPYYIEAEGHEMSGTYRVRRVMDDGCTTLASNELVLSLFDQKLDPDTVETYAFTPEMTSFRRNDGIVSGYEIGDSIFFSSKERNADLIWYLDPECTEVLANGSTFCSMRLTSEIAEQKAGEGAYIYVKARREECIGEAVAIPFEYGTESNGGTIYISDSIICHNGIYSDVINETPASGTYVAPVYGQMKWTYTWQYKRSRDSRTGWSKIEGETGAGLSADVINEISSITITDSTPLLIRRVATNDKGRVRYSNVLVLTHYKRLVPGTISLNGTKDKFCSYDALPYVKKALPASGGKVHGAYNVTWQYNVNGEEWETAYAIDSLYMGWLTDSLDRTVNNTINVRCKYADECEEVISEPVQVTLYRTNDIPSIYQNSDSCNAEEVRLTVYKDEFEKTYHWYGIALYFNEDSTSFTEELYWHRTGDDNLIRRYTSMAVDYYGARSEDMETGCFSDFYYFYVDSLPKLDQTAPIAPIAVCPNSDLEIKGGTLSGGNGEKSFQWQTSLTGREDDYSDIVDATGEDLQLQAKFFITASYFRRIVTDMCDADTSDAVYVGIRPSVAVSPEDISFDDFKCPLGMFSSKVVAEKDSLALSEYWTLGSDTFMVADKSIQMVGFEGDSMSYPFTHFVTDSTGLTCPSEVIYVTAHNKPAITENTITTENYKPCNESIVRINGTLLGGAYPDKIKYTWYVNNKEQVGEFGANLRYNAKDSMSIVRIADNGCRQDTSNILHLEGQPVFNYDYRQELSMEVVSNSADSSVALNIFGSKMFSEGYYIEGDGELPVISSNNIRLPYQYDIYKDSALAVYAKTSYCVRPYAINPLRGGVISFDGGTQLCGDEDVPPIVVTELEGGEGNPQYQWQYKNARTPDFINIDNATDKTYTPSAIDIATTYRRIATDGVYKAISNELTLSIRPIPSVAMIDIDPEWGNSLSDLSKMGLKYVRNVEYQWIPNTDVMNIYLADSANSADRTYWQKSYDQSEWINVKSEYKDHMFVNDTTSNVYYRYIAENACGADTSSVVRIYTAHIDPITDDQVDYYGTLGTDSFTCRNDEVKRGEIYLRFVLKDNVYRNSKYLYSYKVKGGKAFGWTYPISPIEGDTIYDKHGMYKVVKDTVMAESRGVFISELDENGDRQIPYDDVTVYVTRHDTARGLSVTSAFLLKVDILKIDGLGLNVDGREYMAGESEIELRQGNRVRFIPYVTANNIADVSYSWSLEEPINKPFFSRYGGRNGMDGITSELQNPTCFYYNGGYYPVTLTVTDGRCTSTITDTSLYIPESSVRSYRRSLSLEEEEFDNVYEENENLVLFEHFKVYPLLVTDYVTIESNQPNAKHEARLVDEQGRVMQIIKFMGSAKIEMSGYASGVYYVCLDNGERHRILKR